MTWKSETLLIRWTQSALESFSVLRIHSNVARLLCQAFPIGEFIFCTRRICNYRRLAAASRLLTQGQAVVGAGLELIAQNFQIDFVQLPICKHLSRSVERFPRQGLVLHMIARSFNNVVSESCAFPEPAWHCCQNADESDFSARQEQVWCAARCQVASIRAESDKLEFNSGELNI